MGCANNRIVEWPSKRANIQEPVGPRVSNEQVRVA